jgi:hypothetical protein
MAEGARSDRKGKQLNTSNFFLILPTRGQVMRLSTLRESTSYSCARVGVEPANASRRTRRESRTYVNNAMIWWLRVQGHLFCGQMQFRMILNS